MNAARGICNKAYSDRMETEHSKSEVVMQVIYRCIIYEKLQ